MQECGMEQVGKWPCSQSRLHVSWTGKEETDKQGSQSQEVHECLAKRRYTDARPVESGKEVQRTVIVGLCPGELRR